MTQAVIRIVIAEPGGLLASILALAMSDARFEIVGTCTTVSAMLELSARSDAHVAVLDSGLPGGDLEAAIPRLLTRGTRSFVVSSHPLSQTTTNLLLAGASGFIFTEDGAFESIPTAVEAVASGTSALHPDVAMAVLRQWRSVRTTTLDRDRLSTRELQVLRCLADGLSTRAISRMLVLAEKTVEAHKTRLYGKLGARNQAHAVSIASSRGLLAEPHPGGPS